MSKINEIVHELLSHGILAEVLSLKNGDIAYSFLGFAKSGQGTLFEKDNKLYLATRYDQIDEINDTVDVVKVAFSWDKRYSHSVNYPNTNFLTEDNNWWSLYKKYNLI